VSRPDTVGQFNRDSDTAQGEGPCLEKFNKWSRHELEREMGGLISQTQKKTIKKTRK